MMQECDACGLVFGGTAACPSCGSRVSSEAEVSATEGAIVPTGSLPGMDSLTESMKGIDHLQVHDREEQARRSSLPFSIGGSGGGSTSLPFGVGSPRVGAIDLSQVEVLTEMPAESPDEVFTAESEVHEEPPTEIVAEPEVEAPREDSQDSVLVARIIENDQEVDASPEILESQSVEATPVFIPTPESDGSQEAPVIEDVILHEEDIVYHDFGDEMEFSEVQVDFDSLVDPETDIVTFDPSEVDGGEPELMAARALPTAESSDTNITECSHLGFAALAQAEWKNAADYFKQICSSNPSDSGALNNFGLSLLQQALLIQEGRPTTNPAEEPHFEACILALRQAAKSDPSNVSILCNLATALTSCYRHESALQFYDAALSENPNDVASLNGKAVSLIGTRAYELATELLRQASSLAPEDPIVSANLRRVSPMG